MKYHKLIEKQLVGNKNLFSKQEKILGYEEMSSNIVAKKSFFLNPHENNPKIIKTRDKYYVI